MKIAVFLQFPKEARTNLWLKNDTKKIRGQLFDRDIAFLDKKNLSFCAGLIKKMKMKNESKVAKITLD